MAFCVYDEMGTITVMQSLTETEEPPIRYTGYMRDANTEVDRGGGEEYKRGVLSKIDKLLRAIYTE